MFPGARGGALAIATCAIAVRRVGPSMARAPSPLLQDVPASYCGHVLSPPWVVKGYERAARWLGVAPATYRDVSVAVSAPWLSGRSVQNTYDGVRVNAWLVLKCDTNGIDANMQSLLGKGGHLFARQRRLGAMSTPRNDSLPVARTVVSFAVVREPMEHFVSGYAESITARLDGVEQNDRRWPGSEELLRQLCANGTASYACITDQMDRAGAFLRDYVQTRTNRVRLSFQTTHANSQASFLCLQYPDGRRGVGTDYVIYLDELAYGWEQLGVEAGLRDWPPFESDLFIARKDGNKLYHGDRPHLHHPDWLSNNSRRRAMEAVLKEETNCRALCAVLLVDYVCFRFPLPWCCATSALAQGAVRCPVKIGTFLTRAARPPTELIDPSSAQGRLFDDG